jgi:Spy/CpxP family protein refolding chaperone
LSPLAAIVTAAGILACGGDGGSPLGAERPATPEALAASELEIAGGDIAAAELSALELAFDLDEGQRDAISQALARAREALADLRVRWRAGEIGSAETVAEARAIRETLDAEIAAALTPEQLARIEARRAAFRPDLGLTDQQRAAIRGIVDDWRALVLDTARDLRENELSPREAAEILFDGARAARTAVCGVLDSDQQELFPRCDALLAG